MLGQVLQQCSTQLGRARLGEQHRRHEDLFRHAQQLEHAVRLAEYSVLGHLQRRDTDDLLPLVEREDEQRAPAAHVLPPGGQEIEALQPGIAGCRPQRPIPFGCDGLPPRELRDSLDLESTHRSHRLSSTNGRRQRQAAIST
jgi:hypothetical protein